MKQLSDVFQSVTWGYIQAKIPSRGKFWPFRLGKSHSHEAVLIRQKLPGNYCWLSLARVNVSEALLKEILPIAKAEGAVFLRVDPPADSMGLNLSGDEWQRLGFRKAHATYQPESTLMLDLSLSEEALLLQMKQKGRYNIRVAEKNSVRVELCKGERKDIDAFFELLQKTTERDGFGGHGKSYYETVIRGLSEKDEGGLFLAYSDAPSGEPVKPIAGAILGYPKFGGADAESGSSMLEAPPQKTAATYLYGASDHAFRNLMAPYLLQWAAILEAKKRGFDYYDFLGIAPMLENGEVDKKHPWAGVTEFKKKFGGMVVNYPPSRELVYKPILYTLLRFAKKMREFFLC